MTDRVELAQVLVNAPREIAEPTLLNLAEDDDFLVRANACDSLCNFASEKVVETLKRKLYDTNYLVRGYSVMSLGDIFCENINLRNENVLYKAYQKEKSLWTKGCYWYAFCVLGNEKYVDDLLLLMNHRVYHFRCFAVNTLMNILEAESLTKATREKILSKMKAQEKLEKAKSVKSAFEKIFQ
jgi:UDP-2,3-diacylglucosamine pyrophosphatase LpxH